MPTGTTITIPDGMSPEDLGLVLAYGGVHLPSHSVHSTVHDGYVHQRDAIDCQRCGGIICHRDNVAERTTIIEDIQQRWCNECRDIHSELDDVTGRYFSNLDTHIVDYHRGGRTIDPANEESPFRMGFEIEKEDRDVRKALRSKKLPHGWVAERDGSLEAKSGFEIVTKAYNLRSMDALRKDAEEADWALRGKFTTACGGHIHLSDMRYQPKELYKRILPIFPLFMALFPKRLSRRYCKAAKSRDVSSEKYCAFRLTGQTIELRCPSAVRSAKNLLWRAEVVKLFLLSSKKDPLSWEWMKKQLAKDGQVRSLLIRAYCGKKGEADTEGMKKVNRVIKMTAMFSLWFRDPDRMPDESVRAYIERADDSHERLQASDDEFADDHGAVVLRENDVQKHNQSELDRIAPGEEGSLSGMLELIWAEEPAQTTQPTLVAQEEPEGPDDDLPF